MRILYEDRDLRRKINDMDITERVERIIKFFSVKFGKKIVIKDINIDNGIGYTITIRSFQDNQEYKISVMAPFNNTTKNNVILRHSENFSECYAIYERSGYKLYSENKKENLILRKEKGHYINGRFKQPYTVIIDNKRLHIITTSDDVWIFGMLFELKEIDISLIYNKLNEHNKSYVEDLFIEVIYSDDNCKEKLITSHGKLTCYEKHYVHNDINVILTYYGDHISVTTNQKIDCSKPLITSEVNVEGELTKVKKLFK